MSERKAAVAQSHDEILEAPLVELPASASKVDRDLVDRSVTHIREVIAKTLSAGQDEIGRYLLKSFFNDDPEVYQSQVATKHLSLRKLLDRCESLELPVSRTFLVNALRLAVVTRGLPNKASFNQLPP